jgi:hypothetical protein
MLALNGADAVQALLAGTIDGAFLTGDAAQPAVMAQLMRSPDVHLFSVTQAQAYTRRFPFLTQVEVPMGVFDLGDNLPPTPIDTVVTTIELIARNTLHPALSDLLVEAAYEVHGEASLMQKAGEFPSPITHDFPLSPDAARYYKSGKSFLYRTMPFWVASLMDRLLVVIVPIIVVLIPALRLVPPLYAWRVKSRIYRRYGQLIAIERSAPDVISATHRIELLGKLDTIEQAVNKLRLPLAYADQFYALREHIGFVREKLVAADMKISDRP